MATSKLSQGAALAGILGFGLAAVLAYNQCQQGSPRFPATGEEYAAFPSEGETGEEAQDAFKQLEDLESFLEEHAGESVFLRIHLGASHIRTQADDPMKPVFGIKRYTVAYSTAVFAEDACDDLQNCPDALVRTGSDEPGDATVDFSVRLDRDLNGGVAIAVVQNDWFRAQVSNTQFGIRLKGYFFNTGEASYADQLSVTPYILRPQGKASAS